MLLEPTSPLTESTDIDRALETLDSKRDIADSIVGVCRVEAAHPLFDVRVNAVGLIEPYVPGAFARPIRRQELDSLYFFEGSLYISKVPVLLNKRGFLHERTLPYIVPRWKSIEIDEIVDFICVEAIMKNKDRIHEGKEHG